MSLYLSDDAAVWRRGDSGDPRWQCRTCRWAMFSCSRRSSFPTPASPATPPPASPSAADPGAADRRDLDRPAHRPGDHENRMGAGRRGPIRAVHSVTDDAPRRPRRRHQRRARRHGARRPRHDQRQCWAARSPSSMPVDCHADVTIHRRDWPSHRDTVSSARRRSRRRPAASSRRNPVCSAPPLVRSHRRRRCWTGAWTRCFRRSCSTASWTAARRAGSRSATCSTVRPMPPTS